MSRVFQFGPGRNSSYSDDVPESDIKSYSTLWLLFIGLVALYSSYNSLRAPLRFVWHCFLRPLGKSVNQQDRLDQFYQGQAEIYDSTRHRLLRGRKTMLKLAAAHMRERKSTKPLVWVDIGGGTGWNIETMDTYLPVKQFDAIYLVDLCDPLLEIARRRFASKGWTNVHIIHSDACTFQLPHGGSLSNSASLVTLSYSLSMIPPYHRLLDRVDQMLDPTHGLVGVVDFYASRKNAGLHEESIGGVGKIVGWLGHWFWQMWFDLDHVDLSPGRRDYLQYKFGTVKILNGRNGMFLPWFIQIPYYVWLGCSRSVNVSAALQAFETDSGNSVGNYSPKPVASTTGLKRVSSVIRLGEDGSDSEVDVDTQLEQVVPPSSAFHYHSQTPWRLPYYTHAVHNEFRTFIYAFTWEDPMEDMKYLGLTKDSSILCISSAGDNALHYAIAAGPKRIHCVDMNPCQGHLVELKLAALRTLSHATFFGMFGSGKLSDFEALLDNDLSPWLSSAAYQFWRQNQCAFDKSFYRRGYSGWALRITQWVLTLGGVLEDAKRMCNVDTIEEQDRIWREKLRPVLLSNWFVKLVLDNPAFLWNALGVPLAQRRAFLNEGSCYEFARDTLDPIASTALLKTGAYHYLLCLLGRYTPSSCPAYLTREGFDNLRKNNFERLESFRLHTESITNVLRGMQPGQLTHAVIMDHLDWFDPGATEVEEEVVELKRVLLPGSTVFWRSAARNPWYCEVFERNGFALTPVGVRNGPERAIDRVNMYASFWKGTRVA
ncbi:betaine lipid synthase [Rhizoctonia solani AG-1 IB]|uniref:Betaine lipid synthase n=1 Tax=Thanatephorus cucumeris (strain AG1-IB / isolate 7/3/14) TaxID=1108050 RepID=A0A0B7FSK7_THACB|nr:betaine lipid synthase [Rhizoctonia solani AG-1 IB]